MKPLLLSWIILGCQILSAQTLRVGVAVDFTSGNYSGTNIARSDNLFAKNGSSYAFSFEYPVKKNILLLLESGKGTHPFNQSSYASAYTLISGKQTEITSVSDYSMTWMMLGTGYQIPKGKFTFQAEVQAGLMFLNTPSYLLHYKYTGNTATESISSNHASAYAFSWALRGQYPIYKNLLLGLWLRNMSATFELPTINYTSSNPVTKSCKMEIYQTGISIGYQF